MKTTSLDQWLKNLELGRMSPIINENDRYELLKYGVNAMALLSMEKQAFICLTFSAIFKQKTI